MSEPKTRPTNEDVAEFLDGILHERKREDSRTAVALLTDVTGLEPKMWGEGIVGFGEYHYKYKSGREGDWFRVGFAPRKRSLSFYIMPGLEGFEDILEDLGKHRTGKSCLYVNKLDDIDLDVLRELVEASLEKLEERYPPDDDEA